MEKEFLNKQKIKLEAERQEIKKELESLSDGGKISEHFRVKYPQLGYSEDENAEDRDN